jgi:hypothetical protein
MDCKEGIWQLKSEGRRLKNSAQTGHTLGFRDCASFGVKPRGGLAAMCRFRILAFGFALLFVGRKALLAACPVVFLI